MSADDNAPEQAREVEVVVDILLNDVGLALADRSRNLAGAQATLKAIATAERVLAALAPLRAVERQEAARAALIEAAGDIAERIAAVVDPDSWRRDGFDEGWAHAGEKIDGLLRARADGVTGRSAT